jgi:hypothetical protein
MNSFKTWYDNGNGAIKHNIIEFALHKLLDRTSDQPSNPSTSIAPLARGEKFGNPF